MVMYIGIQQITGHIVHTLEKEENTEAPQFHIVVNEQMSIHERFKLIKQPIHIVQLVLNHRIQVPFYHQMV